ncbi:Hypothetical predicted protein [Olea europaea subsp. europaea]|uniref:Uncharacterized protein n=1 Tax=Olea europaea subsp. europaea TaxID=158383 RepID=A0A8S0T7X1_OLEEU|nr:Hypothetical predicted protein [Olea europaea subsp. europaea]
MRAWTGDPRTSAFCSCHPTCRSRHQTKYVSTQEAPVSLEFSVEIVIVVFIWSSLLITWRK